MFAGEDGALDVPGALAALLEFAAPLSAPPKVTAGWLSRPLDFLLSAPGSCPGC